MTERQIHEHSDDVLNDTTKMLNKQYNAAYKEARDFLAIELAKVELSGTAQERFGELSKYDRLDKICEKLANIFVNANKASKKEVNNLAVSVYKINYDWQAEQLGLKGTNKAESKEAYEEVDIFDTIAFAALTDKKSIEREIKSKIVQALMSKAGVRPIITAIKNVAESNLSDNVRIATTATTQTENKGRADVVEVAKKQGRKFRKVWRAVGDNRTRQAHRAASGQVQDFDKPFIVGGEKMMYPADISLGASAKNTINCRCRMAVIEYK